MRLVVKRKVSDREMDEMLMDLHWLKVKFRSVYKILLIVHNCLHERAPNEIIELLNYGDSIRTMHLRETRCLNKYGVRGFSHVGPKLWNLLPMEIREVRETDDFKKVLKSFLMTRGEEFLSWTKMC